MLRNFEIEPFDDAAARLPDIDRQRPAAERERS
jgi:hypothetical protein